MSERLEACTAILDARPKRVEFTAEQYRAIVSVFTSRKEHVGVNRPSEVGFEQGVLDALAAAVDVG